MSIENQKTEEMEVFEKETGRHAIWHGTITESFKKWKNRKVDFIQEKERITTLVTADQKKKWQNFVDKYEISTISKLIRTAVENYIENGPKLSYLNNISNLSKDLKTPLTPIKGFSQLIIDNYSDQMDPGLLSKMKEIYTQSQKLEDKINEILSILEPEKSKEKYDILIVDNDDSTITVLEDFFEFNGYACKGMSNGTKALEELKRYTPKLILISIILPDIKGNDVSDKIRSYKNFKDIPLFYITVLSETEAIKITNKTKATGYFLKPFNFTELKRLFRYL
ncbi:MAG: Signal transduction response regulator [Candidatus Lokiarchaeum sp. GC14_75]|nr:MAG: Signal transduction response regulator [Candidatus Lokiarchaeum sp. GC14_75]